MKVILREDESGVSEVVGTILILGMTVVLFSTIIIWVTNIPTPSAQTRLEIGATMTPLVPTGVNLLLTHDGGESLYPVPTIIYVTYQRGSALPQTDVVILHPYNALLAIPSGLLDGSDSIWEIGERWAYKNVNIQATDDISITIVDALKGVVVWNGRVTQPAGPRPPVFAEKWTDGTIDTPSIDPVQDNLPFNFYVKVIDPDGDLNRDSVYATLTMWYNSGTSCEDPLKMLDNGVPPDKAAGDDIFTLIPSFCTRAAELSWDGAIILLNATDLAGHETRTRFVLNVVEQFTGGSTQTIPSQLWQYIGFIQVRAEEAWFTQLQRPVGTSERFSLGRVRVTDLNSGGGALFHLLMANHGNRTVFVDGYTALSFRSASSSNVQTIYIVCGVRRDPAGNVKCLVDPTRPANAGGLTKYPGLDGVYNNFQYVQVFNIDPLNQEKGGAPVEILATCRTRFGCPTNQVQTIQWGADSYYPSILISGIMGPLNMTYQEIIARWGTGYNPFDHLQDADPATRTMWYAQVIPFIAMTVI